jgi:hypothetical protein
MQTKNTVVLGEFLYIVKFSASRLAETLPDKLILVILFPASRYQDKLLESGANGTTCQHLVTRLQGTGCGFETRPATGEQTLNKGKGAGETSFISYSIEKAT